MPAWFRKIGSFIWWVIRLGGVAGALRDIYQVIAYLAAYGPPLVVAALFSTFDFAERMDIWLRLAFFVGVFFCMLAVTGAALALAIKYLSAPGRRVESESQSYASEPVDPRQVQEIKLKSRGLPTDMVAEKHIRYRESPVRLVDLLEVAGEDGVLRGFTFERCILEGPGIINLGGPFPKPETTASGVSATLSVGPSNCRVEGSPETALYEITSDSKPLIGVIHLEGYTLREVTFRDLGFAGTPDELERLREQLNFSGGS